MNLTQVNNRAGKKRYALVDTETCSCCDGMKHARVERDFDTKEAAVNYVVDHFYPDQLFEGVFDENVIRHYGDDAAGPEPDVAVSQFVKDAGVTLEDAQARKAKRHQAAVDWLTPVKTRVH